MARGLLLAAALLAGCAAIADQVSGRAESCAIIRSGVPAEGRILKLADTGVTINNDPVVEFVLLVTPRSGEPFEARSKALVSRLDIPAVQPGRVLPVRFDPQDRARVALDVLDCK